MTAGMLPFGTGSRFIAHGVRDHTMTRSDYFERKEARIERFQELAQKNEIKSAQLHDQAHKMADAIPFGQPILIGHHSEKRDRNYRDRIWTKTEQAIETQKKADYYAQKAASAESNNAISSDNPDAIEELKEKLKKCQEFQDHAKTVNKIVRKKIPDDKKIIELIASGMHEGTAQKCLIPDYVGRIGIPAYALTNNNANMRRIKERIEQLEKEKSDITTEQVIGNISIINSVEENRILITFPGIPDEAIRNKLKSDGFRWSPSNKSWQAYRSAAWKIPYIIKFLLAMPGYVNPENYLFAEMI